MRRLASYIVAMGAVVAGSYLLYQYRDVTVSAPQTSSEIDIDANIETAHLSNGMEVVVVPNHRVPAVSHTIWLSVGGADDPLGKSGLAHYLEHLMFKGTPDMPSGEYSKRIEQLGGNHNAFTGRDFTGYYVNIAKEHLEEVMRLEADRFQHLTIPESEYQKERDVIIEERRSRIDNHPAARLSEQMDAIQFQHHPYRIPIIGWLHEMKALTLADAEAFYEQFYHPANMLLVIAGDVTMQDVLPLAEQYYGTIPAGKPYQRNWVQEPPHSTSPLIELRDEEVKQPRWQRRYVASGLVYGDTKQAMPLMMLSQWLGGGKTSLLYQQLVVEKKLATSASASYSALGVGPSILSVHVTPAVGVPLTRIDEAVDQIIESTSSVDMTDGELRRIKTLLKADVIYARDGLSSIAQFVGYLRMIGLNPSLFNEWTDLIESTDAAAIKAAAHSVFDQPYVTGHLLPINYENPVELVPVMIEEVIEIEDGGADE